ncbi:uncharacterized protein EV154DRAFT_580371 [Mucor mucedo]|uniref:uncharacterized protein n=1 Tax=Mucor mucedo TaxID=29922 RepID=UPI0022202342|nr:uncharacterized protein EV154DRAFT_580371 [Mucor mucedo]KAI7871116.1 hypothetical protein EV154DRAFT_580371 [Mucor mucedo]
MSVEGNPDATELEKASEKSNTNELGTQGSKWESFCINNSDLPKFQLTSTPGNFYPNSPRYENVKIYLRDFEKIVKASTDHIDVVWKRLIEVNIPRIYDEWVENELTHCNIWAEAKALFGMKFGSFRGREKAI